MSSNKGGPCKICGKQTKNYKAQYCRKCFEKDNGELSMEELDAIEAEQRKNLPAWWTKDQSNQERGR